MSGMREVFYPTPQPPSPASNPAHSADPTLPPASRRHVLGGAIAGGAGLVATASTGGSAAAALPWVQPLGSHALLRSVGVNTMPNHLKSGYRFRNQWLAAMADSRLSYFRGFYARGLPETQQVVSQARARGVRWGMQVASDLSTSEAEIRATVRHIAAHAADRCLFIEGINEPDWNRGRGPSRPGWHQVAVKQQRAIWQAVKAEPRLRHVVVIGPSLRDVSATTADYRRLRDLGLLRYLDYIGTHCYPNGRYPDHLLDERISSLRRVWPGKPVWMTETGYHNALANDWGHKPVPEWVAADYAAAAVLEAADRGLKMTWFELLDQPDPGSKSDRESNFGFFATRAGQGPPWRAKPAVSSLRSFLAGLSDPGPGFDPRPVRLGVETSTRDVRVSVTVKRNGAATAHVRRATDCWDAIAQRRIHVAKARVRLLTPSGTRTVSVDHRVTSVRL